jgi:hypothetical protein
MTSPIGANHGISPLAIEFALTAIMVLTVLGWPQLGFSFFSRVEGLFMPIARRRGLAVVSVGIGSLLLRLAILPFFPIPLPFSPDDFSNLLAADTFAHGRLTNPTPPMWTHLESIHISMQPTYMSMYFPGLGLILAAGKVLLGNPWYGVLIASALMCASICWMLQAWLPPTWALLGGILAVLRLGLFSYWVNSYTSAGLMAALGGALVLGALPRLIKTASIRNGLVMAAGAALLLLTRPYEGLLLCLPVSIALFRWAFFHKDRPTKRVLIRHAAFPLALIVAAIAWLGYYDFRAFGNPLTLPYTVNRAAYSMAPYFVWQSARPEPYYRHPVMREFYYRNELNVFLANHKLARLVPNILTKLLIATLFFAGLALLPPLIMSRRVLLDSRIRFLVLCVLVLTAGMLIEIYMIPHYLAPFTAAIYAIGLQAMRHLRLWKPDNKPVGLALVRLMVGICLVMSVLRALSVPLHLTVHPSPAAQWALMWYGPDHFGTERALTETRLEQLPGKQLAIVRYSSQHDPYNEWVYNAAEIEDSKVIWAREMDAANNRELIDYYKDRAAWLVQPDSQPAMVTQYPAAPIAGARR